MCFAAHPPFTREASPLNKDLLVQLVLRIAAHDAPFGVLSQRCAGRRPRGGHEAAQACVQVSEKKNALDGERGARATEVSAVVAEIGARIRGRKGVLAPKVRRLRQLRAALEERRGAHGEARATYMHAIDAQDGMFGDLERRVATLQAHVSEVRLPAPFVHGILNPLDERVSEVRSRGADVRHVCCRNSAV